ncbi:hypothetical protein C8A03DRAFT_35927 [Achaetomium macrosporum]|uniref:Uncharacterized protein n=1 Tax=Achaetomium macrosporum TaxID=79813 RepID=A0AAN7C889_9PEZI|nr:hypothetical protein C8A03DRAFT_35927 [Achaetomium macrosporum]
MTEQLAGACQIKLCSYTDRRDRARAGFQYGLWRIISLVDMIQLIDGVYPDLPHTMSTDMNTSVFMKVNGFFDGCRDWMWRRWEISQPSAKRSSMVPV